MAMKSLIIAVAFAAGLSIVGTASAQDSIFEGTYLGAQGGYSVIDVDVSVAGVGSASDELDGFGGGVFIGFGGTNGNLYGSIEAEVGYDGAEWSETSGGLSADVEAELTYGVGFRVGAVVAENFLIYGRVGWIRTNLDASLSVVGVGSASDDEDIDGLRVGGGVEGKLGDNIGVRGEFTYTNYEDISSVAGVNVDIDQYLFRVGAAYYF